MEMGRHCRTPADLILPDARADDACMVAPFGKGSFYLCRHRRQEKEPTLVVAVNEEVRTRGALSCGIYYAELLQPPSPNSQATDAGTAQRNVCYVNFHDICIDNDHFLVPIEPSPQDNGCPKTHTLCQTKGQVTHPASSSQPFSDSRLTKKLGKPVKHLPEEVSLPTNGAASDLYTLLALQLGTTVHRLRITKGSDGVHIPNSKDLTLTTTGLREQSTIYVKDLGPQVAWRTVFLVEYLGPLLIHPLLYLTLPSSSGASSLQTLTLTLILIHFLKRELETLFIHRFSAATMPFSNIFKNSAHYWLLSGLNMAYWIYLPSSPTAQPSNPYITYPGLLLFIIGELGNLNSHLVLRNLRSSGGAERGIPKGLGFDIVTCPNYMFEAMAWVGIAMVSWSFSTVFFAVVAVGQMGIWAGKKEERYRKDFGGKYKAKRSVMLPGIW